MTDTKSDTLTAEQMAVTAFSPTEAALAEIEATAKDHVFDVSTPEGEKEARASRAQLVSLRTDLNEKRLELKRPLLAQGAALDDLAKKIEARIRAVEAPIDALIKAKDAEIAAAKAERERVEAMRLRQQQQIIDGILSTPLAVVGESLERIQIAIDLINPDLHLTMDEDFAERAKQAVEQTLIKLDNMRSDARSREAQAEQNRIDREALQASIIAANEAAAAETARLAEEQRKQRDQMEAERVENQKQIDAQREQLAQQQRDLVAQQAEDNSRRQQEEYERERKRREEEKRQRDEEEAARVAAAEAVRQEQEAAAAAHEAEIGWALDFLDSTVGDTSTSKRLAKLIRKLAGR